MILVSFLRGADVNYEKKCKEYTMVYDIFSMYHERGLLPDSVHSADSEEAAIIGEYFAN